MSRAFAETALTNVSARNTPAEAEETKWTRLQTLSFILVYCVTAWSLIIGAVWWAVS